MLFLLGGVSVVETRATNSIFIVFFIFKFELGRLIGALSSGSSALRRRNATLQRHGLIVLQFFVEALPVQLFTQSLASETQLLRNGLARLSECAWVELGLPVFLRRVFGRWASCVACTARRLDCLLYLSRQLLHSVRALRCGLKENSVILFLNLRLGNVRMLPFDLLHEELEVGLQPFLHVLQVADLENIVLEKTQLEVVPVETFEGYNREDEEAAFHGCHGPEWIAGN